jgi:hypothetical protein
MSMSDRGDAICDHAADNLYCLKPAARLCAPSLAYTKFRLGILQGFGEGATPYAAPRLATGGG